MAKGSLPYNPWIVPVLLGHKTCSSPVTADVLKKIQCLESGDEVKLLFDGHFSIPALFTAESIAAQTLQGSEPDDSIVDWDRSKIRVTKYYPHAQFRNTLERSEYILIVKEFCIWASLEGFRPKIDPVPCMEYHTIKKKLAAAWNDRNSAPQTPVSDSVVINHLAEMAIPSQLSGQFSEDSPVAMTPQKSKFDLDDFLIPCSEKEALACIPDDQVWNESQLSNTTGSCAADHSLVDMPNVEPSLNQTCLSTPADKNTIGTARERTSKEDSLFIAIQGKIRDSVSGSGSRDRFSLTATVKKNLQLSAASANSAPSNECTSKQSSKFNSSHGSCAQTTSCISPLDGSSKLSKGKSHTSDHHTDCGTFSLNNNKELAINANTDCSPLQIRDAYQNNACNVTQNEKFDKKTTLTEEDVICGLPVIGCVQRDIVSSRQSSVSVNEKSSSQPCTNDVNTAETGSNPGKKFISVPVQVGDSLLCSPTTIDMSAQVGSSLALYSTQSQKESDLPLSGEKSSGSVRSSDLFTDSGSGKDHPSPVMSNKSPTNSLNNDQSCDDIHSSPELPFCTPMQSPSQTDSVKELHLFMTPTQGEDEDRRIQTAQDGVSEPGSNSGRHVLPLTRSTDVAKNSSPLLSDSLHLASTHTPFSQYTKDGETKSSTNDSSTVEHSPDVIPPSPNSRSVKQSMNQSKLMTSLSRNDFEETHSLNGANTPSVFNFKTSTQKNSCQQIPDFRESPLKTSVSCSENLCSEDKSSTSVPDVSKTPSHALISALKAVSGPSPKPISACMESVENRSDPQDLKGSGGLSNDNEALVLTAGQRESSEGSASRVMSDSPGSKRLTVTVMSCSMDEADSHSPGVISPSPTAKMTNTYCLVQSTSFRTSTQAFPVSDPRFDSCLSPVKASKTMLNKQTQETDVSELESQTPQTASQDNSGSDQHDKCEKTGNSLQCGQVLADQTGVNTLAKDGNTHSQENLCNSSSNGYITIEIGSHKKTDATSLAKKLAFSPEVSDLTRESCTRSKSNAGSSANAKKSAKMIGQIINALNNSSFYKGSATLEENKLNTSGESTVSDSYDDSTDCDEWLYKQHATTNRGQSRIHQSNSRSEPSLNESISSTLSLKSAPAKQSSSRRNKSPLEGKIVSAQSSTPNNLNSPTEAKSLCERNPSQTSSLHLIKSDIKLNSTDENQRLDAQNRLLSGSVNINSPSFASIMQHLPQAVVELEQIGSPVSPHSRKRALYGIPVNTSGKRSTGKRSKLSVIPKTKQKDMPKINLENMPVQQLTLIRTSSSEDEWMPGSTQQHIKPKKTVADKKNDGNNGKRSKTRGRKKKVKPKYDSSVLYRSNTENREEVGDESLPKKRRRKLLPQNLMYESALPLLE